MKLLGQFLTPSPTIARLLTDGPFLASSMTLIIGNEGDDSFPRFMYLCLLKLGITGALLPVARREKGEVRLRASTASGDQRYREAPYGGRYDGPWRVRP